MSSTPKQTPGRLLKDYRRTVKTMYQVRRGGAGLLYHTALHRSDPSGNIRAGRGGGFALSPVRSDSPIAGCPIGVGGG